MSGGGVAVSSIAPRLRGDDFSLVREGSRIHLLVGGESRWTIDPAVFGDKARLAVAHEESRIQIGLRNGVFAGTRCAADFACKLERLEGAWTFNVTFECGIQAEAPLLDWLNCVSPAAGHWQSSRFSPFDELSVAFESDPAVGFLPDWTVTVTGPSTVSLRGLSHPLVASNFRLLLNSPAAIAGQHARSTTVIVPRRGEKWKIDISRRSDHGWQLSHDVAEPLFDELRIEAADVESGTLRSALLVQYPGNEAALQFHPGGALCSDCGDPFTMSLTNTRLAMGLEQEQHSSLVADLAPEPAWAHDIHASYLLAASEASPFFELHEKPDDSPAHPQVSPAVCNICFPSDQACMNLKLGAPRPVWFTWANLLFGPIERVAGWLHLLPSQHAAPMVIDLEGGDVLSIDRPEDMLSLQFSFANMRLETGAFPRIAHIHGKGDPLVNVIFPPQHLAEKAFFHTDDPGGIHAVTLPIGEVERKAFGNPAVNPSLDQLKKTYDPDYQTNSVAPDDDMPATRLSEETRLVFGLPRHGYSIPFHIEALLDWSDWTPIVAPVAKSKVDTSHPANLPQIVKPDSTTNNFTAIELPWHLKLSPSELARWAHSFKPVESEAKVTELWHTRLGIVPKVLPKREERYETVSDETNSKDRVVRAIWSPDFFRVANGDLTCSPVALPADKKFPDHFSAPTASDPFRMSLDARDRCELVHLTSNYAITRQVNFCENNMPLPTDGIKLLPPAPVQVNRMMLTSMGGYLDVIGQWNPAKVDMNHQLTVQLWKHHTTLGRDHYVKVLYKGYLMPFGLRASLVKVTQRYFGKNSGGNWVAILHQHMYIVVKNERKLCPIMGQPYGGRAFPCGYVEPVTLTTPFLNNPSIPWPHDGGMMQSQSLFWPMVTLPDGTSDAFMFQLRFSDITSVHSVVSSMALVFVGSDVAQQDGFSNGMGSQDAVRLYNSGSTKPRNPDDPWLSAKFSGQKFSFAPSTKPGDTDFDTDTIVWRAVPLMATVTGTLTRAGGGSVANASIMLTETVSGTTVTMKTDAGGHFDLETESGAYNVTVTPQPAGPMPATAGPLQLQGSIKYTLNLALNAVGNAFTSAPLLQNPTKTGATPLDLYHYDLPFFYPAVDYARISSSSIKRISGNTSPTKFSFSPTYLADGFNTGTNSGEVFLQKDPEDSLALAFGGTSKNVDKAGGLASPDNLVVGFSRRKGVVGGTMASSTGTGRNKVLTSVSTYSSGKFDAADFFGGLLSAKLLGAVKLSDIIAQLAPGLISNLEKAPQMLEQALYAAESYTQTAIQLIGDFQKNDNPISQRLASQAQQAFAASAALANASNQDALTQGLLEAQLVSRIVDYASAMQKVLQNPLPLAEEAVLDALTSAVQMAIDSPAAMALAQQINALADTCTSALDNAIQNVVVALTPLAETLARQVDDDITKVKQLVSVVAPELENLKSVASAAQALKNSVRGLGTSMHTATSSGLSLQQLPQMVADLSNVAANIQQVYQKAGYLGTVISKTKLANSPEGMAIRAALNAASSKLLQVWQSSTYATDLTKFETDCMKLASGYGPDVAKAQLTMQNLRQLQNSVQQAKNYATAVVSSTPTNDYRRTQLLQKMQGHILRALAALEGLAATLPPGASASVQQAARDIGAAAPSLATALTVVGLLRTPGTTPEEIITVVLADPNLKKPLAAEAADLRLKLQSLRAQILASPPSAALQSVYYQACIDYQRCVGSAQSYLLYLKAASDTALEGLADLVAPVETFAGQVQRSFCGIQSIWTQVRNAINSIPGSNVVPIGRIVLSLFGKDLDAITAAFDNLCNGSQATPSEYLRNGQNLAAAFVALETDIRAKAGGIPAALEAAVLDELKQKAQQLLDNVLSNIPIPTSVSFSYTWNPAIQSFEPVFVLDQDASFSVTASAQAGLNAQLNGIAPPTFDISAKLTNFTINLIGDSPFISLVVDSLTFSSHNGAKPDCRLKLNRVDFGEQMQFVQELASLLDPSEGPFIELGVDSIRAGFRFAVSSLTIGAFNLMQLAIEVAVALPFDGTPLRSEISVSDQEHPFLLSCGIFGGGGFLQLQLGLDGVQLLQGALEFGVCASISIGPLQGDGFCVAGIYFRITSNTAEVCGFVHAHGHMDIFGIITLDVDLYVGVCYQDGLVQGTATFSVSVSIGFFSETFTMQAHYEYQGSSQSGRGSSRLEEGNRPLLASLDARADLVAAAIVPAVALLPAQTLKSNRPPKKKQICPGDWKTDLFINQATWSKYFNSFV